MISILDTRYFDLYLEHGMAKKKKSSLPSASVLDANDELRSKYGDEPIDSALRDRWDAVTDENTQPVEFEPEDEPEEAYIGTAAEKTVSIATGLLTMLLLGGSLVFWWVVLKYLLVSPYSLADPEQMEAMLLSCAIIPAVIAGAQTALRRPASAERWLICMCISGALTTSFVIFIQTVLRSEQISFADVPILLCCAVSGCALPSVIFYGLRAAFAGFVRGYKKARSAQWSDVRRDVLELTNFAFCKR